MATFEQLEKKVMDLEKQVRELKTGRNVTNVENTRNAVFQEVKVGTTVTTPFLTTPDHYLVAEYKGRQYLLPGYDLQ